MNSTGTNLMLKRKEKLKISMSVIKERPPTKPVTLQSPSEICICTRPKTLVLCTWCSHIFNGRIKKSCELHPNVLFLMDYESCPKCKQHIFLLKETGLESQH